MSCLWRRPSSVGGVGLHNVAAYYAFIAHELLVDRRVRLAQDAVDTDGRVHFVDVAHADESAQMGYARRCARMGAVNAAEERSASHDHLGIDARARQRLSLIHI